MTEKTKEAKERPNPSNAPSLLPGDKIIVSKSLDIPESQWNTADVTVVYADAGTCDALVSMRGGTRARYALHYAGDPRLKDHPHWLPPQEPESGVWKLSRREQLVRDNQTSLARMEELTQSLRKDVQDAIKGSARATASLQNWVQEQLIAKKTPAQKA